MNENVMNDQYGMEDLLEQEKYLIHNYGTGACWATTK